MHAIGHTHAHFKRSKGVKLNGILERKILSKIKHRAVNRANHYVFFILVLLTKRMPYLLDCLACSVV
jgi:hypothetical protein